MIVAFMTLSNKHNSNVLEKSKKLSFDQWQELANFQLIRRLQEGGNDSGKRPQNNHATEQATATIPSNASSYEEMQSKEPIAESKAHILPKSELKKRSSNYKRLT